MRTARSLVLARVGSSLPLTDATSDVPDADYLHYGFWLMRTTKDGATTYNEVETFADVLRGSMAPPPLASLMVWR